MSFYYLWVRDVFFFVFIFKFSCYFRIVVFFYVIVKLGFCKEKVFMVEMLFKNTWVGVLSSFLMEMRLY